MLRPWLDLDEPDAGNGALAAEKPILCGEMVIWSGYVTYSWLSRRLSISSVPEAGVCTPNISLNMKTWGGFVVFNSEKAHIGRNSHSCVQGSEELKLKCVWRGWWLFLLDLPRREKRLLDMSRLADCRIWEKDLSIYYMSTHCNNL